MLAMPDLREDARHSVSEHKEVDDMLGELVQMGIGAADWMSKFEEMRHRYLHHIDEEEQDMFPAASEGLSAEDERRIADVFERRKPRELERAAHDQPGDARE
jgi:hemerythrin-like domain-containing protein